MNLGLQKWLSILSEEESQVTESQYTKISVRQLSES